MWFFMQRLCMGAHAHTHIEPTNLDPQIDVSACEIKYDFRLFSMSFRPFMLRSIRRFCVVAWLLSNLSSTNYLGAAVLSIDSFCTTSVCSSVCVSMFVCALTVSASFAIRLPFLGE